MTKEDRLWAMKSAILHEEGIFPDKKPFIMNLVSLDPNLKATLRVLMMEESEYKTHKNAFQDKAISIENEVRIFNLIH